MNSKKLITVKKPLADIDAVIKAFTASIDAKDSTIKTYGESISRFFEWLEKTGKGLNDLGTPDIVEYKKSLLNSDLSILTVKSYMVAVHRFYQWAESEGLYRDIARSVKSPRSTQGMVSEEFIKMDLSEDESIALLKYFHSQSLRNYAIVNMMLRLGLRTIEVSRLNIASIKTVNGQRRLQIWRKGMDKPNPKVTVGLPDPVWLPIEKYLNTRNGAKPDSPLFITEGSGSHGKTRLHSGERMSTRLIQMIIKKGLTEIGLEAHEYSAHSLRHTCAVMMLVKGATLADIQRQLGHSSPNTTMIYLKSYERRILETASPAHVLDQAFDITL